MPVLVVALFLACNVRADESCSRPAEVVLLIDTSRSIWPPDFQRELTFLQNLVAEFDVSPSATRIAAVSFSSGYREEFGLDTYSDVQSVQLALAKIPFTAGDTTDTALAIRYARDTVLSAARPGATRIIICITDGRSNNRDLTIQEADKTRAEGVLLLAVGVGAQVDYGELSRMATESTNQFVHTVTSFPGLESIKSLVAHTACQATLPPQVTTTENPQNDQNQAIQDCGGKPADIVMVLDRSNSVYILDFMEQLSVVQDIVDIMDIGPQKTQVAAVSFSTNVTVEFYLDEFDTKSDIIGRIGKIQYTGGVTETGKALSMVHDSVLSPQHGARSAETQVVIVITDGLSQDMQFTKEAATLLKNDDVHIFAIGVGPHTDRQELENIASSPASDYVFEVDGYQALNSIKYLLAIKACNSQSPAFPSINLSYFTASFCLTSSLTL
ncbi:hypothetical protein BaRGS_00009713 [Batillaria attramentaria]|uniref:VWFA domain-containing protein n=1 Tax=Batillaria attramentaria TaxID=370345 RepID=A0ABD0LI03_9CAEN